jgi:2'-5' RNA ligase
MPISITIPLNDDAADVVREIWHRLSRIGLALDCLVPVNKPHITLAVLQKDSPLLRLRETLHANGKERSCLEVPIPLVGIFPGATSSICLLPTKTPQLATLHQNLVDKISPSNILSHYHPVHWIPHVTLSRNIRDAKLAAAGLQCVLDFWEPIQLRLNAIEIVRFLPVETLESVQLRA